MLLIVHYIPTVGVYVTNLSSYNGLHLCRVKRVRGRVAKTLHKHRHNFEPTRKNLQKHAKMHIIKQTQVQNLEIGISVKSEHKQIVSCLPFFILGGETKI